MKKYQPHIAVSIKNCITSGPKSPIFLFHGNSTQGKQYCALATIKLASCKNNTDFCDQCLECTSINQLSNPHILLLDMSHGWQRLHGLTKHFLKNPNCILEKKIEQILKERTITFSWQSKFADKSNNNESSTESDLHEQWKKKAQSFIKNPICEKTRKQLEKILEKLKKNNPEKQPIISMDMIRHTIHFANLTGTEPRTIIIKNMEYMRPESSSLLLKLLEEPPKNIRMIMLIAQDKNKVLPTIVSRCFCMSFSSWSSETKMEISNKMGINISNSPKSNEPFWTWLSDDNKLRETCNLMAEKYWEILTKSRNHGYLSIFHITEKLQMLNKQYSGKAFQTFLQCLIEKTQQNTMRVPKIKQENQQNTILVHEQFAKKLKKLTSGITTFSWNPELQLNALLIKMHHKIKHIINNQEEN